MSLAAITIKNRAVTYFATALLIAGGIVSFFSLGQLEDPEFTVKNAVIVTQYPGASPQEVELEVTDRIELALQELAEIKKIESFSRAGLSLIEVEIKPEFWADRLPQVWDKMRSKIRDIEASFPSGVSKPDIGDDFGDVFGFQLAIVGDGFSARELEEYAKEIKKELVLVDGVARIDLWGVQKRIIYFDVSQTQLSELGITNDTIIATLQNQNAIVDAGHVNLGSKRYRIAPTGSFLSSEDIGNLTIRPAQSTASGQTGEIIRVRDIGTVRDGYLEPAQTKMRWNGQLALGMSIANEPGVNIVDLGIALEKRVNELQAMLPVGIEIEKFHWQSDIVSAAVNGFLISFAQAVGIVLVLLTFFMGVRLSFIIGLALVFTILGTFVFMALLNIDLQRMSLGALVVALGMMVDNAIVVADGFQVRMRQGMDPEKAAIESADLPAWPLLGATVVAVMAFYPIYASTDSVGEYCATLFLVIAISLLFSWVISMTLTPIMCLDLLKNIKPETGSDPYGSTFFKGYRGLLERAIRFRWLTVGIMVALLVASGVGFTKVKQLFFPNSSMEKFMVDLWMPEGTRIETVSANLKTAEKWLKSDKRVSGVASFIGSGPPRFYLPVSPEKPYQSYGQLIVNVHDFRDVPAIIQDLEPRFIEAFPGALSVLRPFGVGPSNTWKVEMRVSGPANADPVELRKIAKKFEDIVKSEPLAAYVRNDWRQRVKKVVPRYNQERARWASVTREGLAQTAKRAYDGITIGTFRDGDELVPIIVRQIERERKNISGVDTLQVQQTHSAGSVPLAQVIDGIEVGWEDPLIWRLDRRRTITVQTNPIQGQTAPTLRAALVKKVEAVDLPPGYTLEWGGDFESSRDANQSLIPGMVPALAVIAFVVVALFNAFRPPLVILCTIPFALIGITLGLLGFNVAFGFLALLGAMSLSGMMIKNAIVLLDEINIQLENGQTRYDAIIAAAQSRLRPVVLAAGTTVLGVVPLLPDVFWEGMAVTIMGGLTVGSFLTMILLPVLYAIFYNVKSPPRVETA